MESLSEPHPLFPSGEWEGFYTYAYGPEAARHPMTCMLYFQEGTVEGSGQDDLSTFWWRGKYNTVNLQCLMTKYYPTHSVQYEGNVDENGIWGTWRLDYMSGGFHLWRKKAAEEVEVVEEVSQSVGVPL